MSFGNEIKDFVAAFQVGAGAVNNARDADAKRKYMASQANYYDARSKYYSEGGAAGAKNAGPDAARAAGEAGYDARTGRVADVAGGGGGGGGGGANATRTANKDLPAYASALLDTIAGTEAPGYNAMYSPDRPRRFQGYADHPYSPARIKSGPNAGKMSDAAGRYQFLGSTWREEKERLGLKDFSPESQDLAAWDLAKRTYRDKTGQSLDDALRGADPQQLANVGKTLSGRWTSLPGGIEAGTNTNKFYKSFTANLGKYQSGAPDAAIQTADAAPEKSKAYPVAGIPGKLANPELPADDPANQIYQPGATAMDPSQMGVPDPAQIPAPKVPAPQMASRGALPIDAPTGERKPIPRPLMQDFFNKVAQNPGLRPKYLEFFKGNNYDTSALDDPEPQVAALPLD